MPSVRQQKNTRRPQRWYSKWTELELNQRYGDYISYPFSKTCTLHLTFVKLTVLVRPVWQWENSRHSDKQLHLFQIFLTAKLSSHCHFVMGDESTAKPVLLFWKVSSSAFLWWTLVSHLNTAVRNWLRGFETFFQEVLKLTKKWTES